jgi:predicted permease
MLADLRHSLRLLRRTPGFTAVAVLVLALGIGANTAVFTLVDALVLQPRQGRIDQLVAVFNRDRTTPDYRNFSYATYVDLRDRSGLFESLLAHSFTSVGIRDGAVTRQAFATLVSSNYFTTLGVPLAAGRPFTPDEERPGHTASVAIASYTEWRRREFDPNYIGSTVRINGTAFTVIGVTPKGFAGPFAFVSPQWWLPLGSYDTITNAVFKESDAGLAARSNHALNLAGAPKSGVTQAAMAPVLDAFAKRLSDAYPDTDRDRTFTTTMLPRMGISSRPQSNGPLVLVGALLALAAALVLAVACFNLANLLLARSAARRREFAIRQALGSGRRRIVQQIVVEGLTLSALGAAVGIAVSWWTTAALTSWLSSILTFGIDIIIAPSSRLFAAAVAFAALSTILFALGPAWSASRLDVTEHLKLAPGRGARRTFGRSLLVVGQIAVSLALVAAGGLFARGAIAASSADVGYPLTGQIVIGLDPSLAGYDVARTRAIYRAVLERVRRLASVSRASVASTVAFGDVQMGARVRTRQTDDEIEAGMDVVGADYFTTLGAPVIRGREFTSEEESTATGASPAIVDGHLARLLFGEADAVGRSFELRVRGSDAPQSFHVVGVAPPIRHDLFEMPAQPHVYLPYGSRSTTMMTLHLRAAPGVPERALLEAAVKELRALDPQLPVLTARTMTAQRDESISMWGVRAAAVLFVAFGALALLLATMGVYGLKAYDVSTRTQEIGIRMAMGATSGDVQRLVLGEGARTTAIGLVAGLALAVALGKLASSLLYRVSPFDPAVLTLAAVALFAAAMLACYLPARRATRVVPLEALRSE